MERDDLRRMITGLRRVFFAAVLVTKVDFFCLLTGLASSALPINGTEGGTGVGGLAGLRVKFWPSGLVRRRRVVLLRRSPCEEFGFFRIGGRGGRLDFFSGMALLAEETLAGPSMKANAWLPSEIRWNSLARVEPCNVLRRSLLPQILQKKFSSRWPTVPRWAEGLML